MPATKTKHPIVLFGLRLFLLGASLLLWFNARADVTSPITPVSVLTYHNDNARTGQNTNEAILTPANVGSANFVKLFSQTVDGYVLAQPLIAANVTIPGKGVHNVLFIATAHDSVYAFDADSSNSTPLWQTSFINPAAGVTTVPATDTGVSQSTVPKEIGITGTPVIDPTTGTLYAEVRTKEVSGSSTNYVHRLHALDITTGAEKFGGPVAITASVVGTGDGASGGQVVFNGLFALNRCALLLNNGVVYAAYASLGDKTPYHGWLFGYDAQTLVQTYVFNSNPNGSDSGFWESGSGPATDSNGNIYASTGNGTFDGPTNQDYGDSLLKLSPTNSALALADFFTPQNQYLMNTNDKDFGSGGIMILPDEAGSTNHPHLLVCADKLGTIYLVDRDNLTHFQTPVDQVVQEMPGIILKSWGSPAYYNHTVYYIGASDVLKAFSLSNAVIGTTIVSNSTIYTSTGGSPIVSANGTSNGIVWAINLTNSTLHAYYATNVASEIGTGQSLGSSVKFSTATVANGKVYVGTTNAALIYGLSTPIITAQPQSLQVLPGTNVTFSIAASSTAAPLHYQWFKNSIALGNQTNAALVLANVQVTDAGLYSAVVSDNVGTALSVNAVLSLSGIVKNNDGTVTVSFVGIPAHAYHLEATTNLSASPIAWQMLPGSATNAPSGGLWQFTDSAATNYSQRFYRSVSP